MTTKRLLQSYLDTRQIPLRELAGARELHAQLKQSHPEFYSHVPSDHYADVSHRALAFVTWVHDRSTPESQILDKTAHVTGENLLPLLDALRVNRINGRRVSRIGTRLLLNRPDLGSLAALHRQRMISIFKHLLGERTWSSLKRALAAKAISPQQQRFVDRAILRYATDSDRALETLRFLTGCGITTASSKPTKPSRLAFPWMQTRTEPDYQVTDPALQQAIAVRRDWRHGKGMPIQSLLGLRGRYFPEVPTRELMQIAETESSQTSIVNNLTETIKHAIAGKPEQLPTVQQSNPIHARLGIVLDSSASMSSSGERQNHPSALGQVICHLLKAHVAEVDVSVVGGDQNGAVVSPCGNTDLATACLDIITTEPDLVLIVTDGFENALQGDVCHVQAGLRQLKIDIPTYQVVPLYVDSEDLTDRTLSPDIPVIRICRESQVGELIARSALLTKRSVPETRLVEIMTEFAMRPVQSHK